MKRRHLAFALLSLVSVAAVAQPADRDALLTPDGTLYTVASERVPSLGRVLRLTIQRGEDASTSLVPATANGGYHSEPALAYDPENQTLFLFWQTTPAPLSSSLLFCSYQNGVWSDPTEFAGGIFRFQWNLRIGVTRYLEDEQPDGSLIRKRASIVHAVWWEETGYGESARYAMLSVDGGNIVVSEIRDLLSFVENASGEPHSLAEGFNRDFLRQPAIFEQPGADSVEVLFADWNTARMYRVEITPRKSHGVLRPPIGRTRGRIGAPRAMAVSDIGRISVLPGRPGSESLLFYFESDNRLNYLMFSEAGWSDLQSISLNDMVTREVGVNALRKLLASE